MCLPNLLKFLSLAFVGPICANLCLWPLLTSSTVRAFLQFSAFGEIVYWTAPWWWAEVRNSESPEGLPLSLLFCLSVCLSFCVSVNKLQVTVFHSATYFFENMFFMPMGRKGIFHFPKLLLLTYLGPFFTFFIVFFSYLSLYWPLVTPFDLQAQFLACRLIMT